MSGIWKNPQAGLALAVVMAASMCFYVQHVLIPHQIADAVLHARPRGILSDLYPRWLGTRELLLDHRNPYGVEVTREIQIGYYGRPLDANRPNDPKDEQRFAYPIYVAFLLAPTVNVPFAEVRAVFTWVLGTATAVSVWLWLSALRWHPPLSVMAILVILSAGSFGALQGMKLQQLTLLVAALIAASAALLARRKFVLSGILLAVASIKPQLMILAAVALIAWSLNNWRERRGFVWGFLLTGAVLSAGGACLLPDWPRQFVAGLAAYNRYTGGRSLLVELTTPLIGAILTVLILLSTAIVCWRLRRVTAGSAGFNFCLALLLAVTVVVVPMIAPYNHLLLLPAVFLIVQSWQDIWKRGRMVQLLSCVAAFLVLWPWIAAIGIASAAMFLPSTAVQQAWAVPLWSSLGIPLAILGLLTLCFQFFVKKEQIA